jgi:hypothetical protein
MPERPPVSTIELSHQSELFTVRLWREQLNDHWEWRGRVQHVMSGETRYFRDWQTLLAFIQEPREQASVSELNWQG